MATTQWSSSSEAMLLICTVTSTSMGLGPIGNILGLGLTAPKGASATSAASSTTLAVAAISPVEIQWWLARRWLAQRHVRQTAMDTDTSVCSPRISASAAMPMAAKVPQQMRQPVELSWVEWPLCAQMVPMTAQGIMRCIVAAPALAARRVLCLTQVSGPCRGPPLMLLSWPTAAVVPPTSANPSADHTQHSQVHASALPTRRERT